MKSIKTYHVENLDFRISRIKTTYEKRSGKSDEPHRHDFYTVLVIKKAQGVHNIDFNAYSLDNHQVYFIAPGQVHQLVEDESPVGFSLLFSVQFLIQNGIEVAFIDSLNLFEDYGQSPPLTPNKMQFNKIDNYCSEMYKLEKGSANMKTLSIGAYLKLLLIDCNNICDINPIEINLDNSGNHIVRNFKKLLNQKYKEEHSTRYYANELHITSDHLNRIIKSKIGKTAKEYIQSKIITEAKRLLYFSNLNAKEIGYVLGFNEPGNFSAFFKKCTNSSPLAFRKAFKNN